MKHKKFKVVDTYNNPLILSYLCGFPIAEARYDVVTPLMKVYDAGRGVIIESSKIIYILSKNKRKINKIKNHLEKKVKRDMNEFGIKGDFKLEEILN